jgi:hypothetical protein
MLAAIAELGVPSQSRVEATTATEPKLADRAERRQVTAMFSGLVDSRRRWSSGSRRRPRTGALRRLAVTSYGNAMPRRCSARAVF